MPLQRYDVRDRVRDDTWVERYWRPVNVPVFGLGSREIVYVVHNVHDVTPLVLTSRQVDEDMLVIRELATTVRRMRQDAHRKRRELSLLERHVESAVRDLARGAQPRGVLLARSDPREVDLVAGSVPPVSGCYYAFHPPMCPRRFSTALSLDGKPLPPCRVCGDAVRYRLASALG